MPLARPPVESFVAFTGLRARRLAGCRSRGATNRRRPPTYLRLLLCASACVPLHSNPIIRYPLSPLQPAESIGF